MYLGKKIKLLRKSKGITQEQLAELLKVSSQAVSKWETGVTNPDISLIPEIAKIFNISSDELLGINSDKNNSSVSDIERDYFNERLDRLERIIAVFSAKDDNEALGIMLDEAKKVVVFDFTKIDDFEKSDWKLVRSKLVDGNNKLIFKPTPIEQIVGKTIDPMVVNSKIELNIDNVENIFIRIKTDINSFGFVPSFVQNINFPIQLGVYFITKESPNWDERKCLKNLYTTNTMSNVRLNATSNNLWRGTLTGIRIDPMEKLEGVVEIERISLVDVNGEIVYDYDFTDIDAFEASDWIVSYAKLLESDNCLKLDVAATDNKAVIYDPIVQNDNICIDISRAKYVHIRIKTLLENNQNHRGWYNNYIYYDSFLQVYFKTEHNNVYTQDKSVKAYYGSGAMTDVYVDMSKNSLWNGNLTGIRVDPVEGLCGTFEIELVEILEAETFSGFGVMLKDIESRLSNIEDLIENVEVRFDDIQCRIDDLEE